MRGVRLIGSGSSVPDKVMTNDDLAELVDTSDEWIATRTGIRKRRIVDAPDVGVATLAADAGRKAIAAAGITVQDLDLILLATSTPDDLFGTAAKVQELLGAEQAVAFDISAACSGFVFGLVTAAQFLRTGAYQNILLIGADVLSRWVDWSDRGTCILFGDGAGAVVMQGSDQDRLLGFELRSNGQGNCLLNLSYDRDLHTYAPITMNGKEVYKFAVTAVPEVIEKALHRANLQVADIDWLILHQANQRILDAVQARMGIDPNKVVSNLANYGNTSAASIPLALDEWVRAGKIQPGDAIATSGFGAGLSWGAAIFRWH
jgi:3-oxoacyl-[acyl-carrier-protein] synthase-3